MYFSNNVIINVKDFDVLTSNIWRYSTAWYDSARFVFPLQFSTALGRAGLFTSSEKRFLFRVTPSSTRWIHSSAINERNVCTSSTDKETDNCLVINKRCAHSKQLRSILRWLIEI